MGPSVAGPELGLGPRVASGGGASAEVGGAWPKVGGAWSKVCAVGGVLLGMGVVSSGVGVVTGTALSMVEVPWPSGVDGDGVMLGGGGGGRV